MKLGRIVQSFFLSQLIFSLDPSDPIFLKDILFIIRIIVAYQSFNFQLCIGDRAKLICSPDYAYGREGYPGVYPLNAID